MKRIDLNKYLPKQRNTGTWIGAGLNIWGGGNVFINPMMQFMGATNTYILVTMFFGQKIELWHFYILLALVYIISMSLYWIYVLPSQISFSNSQHYQHDNPSMDLLRKIDADNQLIKKHIGITVKDEEEYRKEGEKIAKEIAKHIQEKSKEI